MPRPQDKEFAPDERLYRAIRHDDVCDGMVLGNSIKGMPRPSFNRSKYGGPADARAAKSEYPLVAWTTVDRVSGFVLALEPTGVEVIAAPFDAPTGLPGGHSHCEVRFRRVTDPIDWTWDPNNSQKRRLRDWLAASLQVLVESTNGTD